MAKRPESPDWPDIAPSELQETVLGLLEDAGIPTATNDQIMRLISNAESSINEAAWERHCEKMMEEGPGPSLLDQQIEAMKFK